MLTLLMCFYFLQINQTMTFPDKNVTKDIQRKWLMEICRRYVEEYVMQSDEVDRLVQRIGNFQEQLQEMDASRITGFACRVTRCEMKYVSHSNRVK